MVDSLIITEAGAYACVNPIYVKAAYNGGIPVLETITLPNETTCSGIKNLDQLLETNEPLVLANTDGNGNTVTEYVVGLIEGRADAKLVQKSGICAIEGGTITEVASLYGLLPGLLGIGVEAYRNGVQQRPFSIPFLPATVNIPCDGASWEIETYTNVGGSTELDRERVVYDPSSSTYQITGIDYDGDGNVDNPVVGSSMAQIFPTYCAAPEDYTQEVIVEPTGDYGFNIIDKPSFMSFNDGTGEMIINPICGVHPNGDYLIQLRATDGITNSEWVDYTIEVRGN